MTLKDIKKAVALKYDQVQDLAPTVAAKGQGSVAEKIIDLARRHNIPMVEDHNLVQLLDTLDINTEIPPELYQAVAEVLVFVYRMNQQISRPEGPQKL